MSMAVTVRATAKTGSNQYVTAVTAVRIHVVCFVGSHAWDTIQNLANIKFINSTNIDIAVVVSVNDELAHPFIDCATSIERTVIADSLLRTGIKPRENMGFSREMDI
ncbi:hypothetical protein FGIG_01140 [Fasciola gigantica]|uniref:Uncharacterized protein n=1 Tax=Fasciola gigantica TaxID=46835 RepID=A0A504YVK8_FASGI|nr:hypothetical protein FGIG_01140 [Fasciola gigantica]